MKRATLSLALALLGPASLAAQLDGRWEGAIRIQGQELGIIVQFTTTDGMLSATIDIPAQGAAGMPLDSVDHQHPSISFQLPTPIGTAYFEGEHDGDATSGDFSQGPAAATFYLSRSEGGSSLLVAAQSG